MATRSTLLFGSLVASAVSVLAPQAAAATGTWTPLHTQPPKAVDTCELVTDGSVMCHEAGTAHWHRLSPDSQGNYVSGPWDSPPIADMPNVSIDAGSTGSCSNCPYAPLYFASAVLADGRVVVVGGEYFFTPGGQALLIWSNVGFVYDPVGNTWSGPLTGGFGQGSVGDAMGTVLADGRFVLQDIANKNMESLDPATLSFTVLNPPGKIDSNDEENWNVLPSGELLAIDSTVPSSFELYNPTTNAWGQSGATPVNLADTDTSLPDGGARQPTYEVGPGVLRPDGSLVRFAANLSGQNAVYNTSMGTWTHSASGDFPSGFEVQDGPASLLPNGNVLVMASAGQSPPSHFYEFTLGANSLQATVDPGCAPSVAAYATRMILLPTGDVLLTGCGSVQTYSNGGQPLDAWRPVVTTAPPSQLVAGNTYGLSGQLFNGFSEGSFYGDDGQSSTNYPLVRITNNATGHARYARTHGHSRMGVESVGSTQIVSTQFDVPHGLEAGPSTLVVVANGIASLPVNVSVGGVVASVPATGAREEGALAGALLLLGVTGALRFASGVTRLS
jgi:hypothetical protein